MKSNRVMTKKEVIQMYRDWRKANCNRKPNRAIVKMYWEDETHNDIKVDTVSLESFDVDTKEDALILFYASGLKGLLSLMKPDNGSDFVILEVLEFYNAKK